jgi:hypothetical protein
LYYMSATYASIDDVVRPPFSPGASRVQPL